MPVTGGSADAAAGFSAEAREQLVAAAVLFWELLLHHRDVSTR